MTKRKKKKIPRPVQRSRLNEEMMQQCEVGLVQGANLAAMAVVLSEQHGVTVRTVERYCRTVRDRWAKEEAQARPAKRGQFRAMIFDTYRMARELENPIAMAAAVRLLAKFEGMESPVEIKVTGGIDIRAMAPKERRDKIEELLEIRANAQLTNSDDNPTH